MDNTFFLYFLLAVVVGATLYISVGALSAGLLKAAGLYWKFRGTRVVTCPETARPVAVEMDAVRTAATGAFAAPEFRLRSCTRWPERQDCGQECLPQIEEAPELRLARTMAADWYEGKACALCGKTFGDIRRELHQPALLDAGRKLADWRAVAPERLPEVFVTGRPVCWDCFVAESFRAQHPELVTDRPWRGSFPARH